MAVTWQNNSEISYEQWLHLRNNSIGASETSVILFGSKYSSNLEIFYQKVGAPRQNFENLRMYIGKETEDISAYSLWQYYDGYKEQSIVDNARKKTPVKKCINLNATVFNDKYPQLSATPDRQIQPFGKYEGRGYGFLEIKNTQSWVLSSYDTGLPTENVVQLCQQLMLGEVDYGELFYFIDNMRCQTHEINRSDMAQLEETIIAYTEPFWANVLKARPIYNQMYEHQRNTNMRGVAECQKALIELEPPVQNTVGYKNFLTQRFQDKMQGVGIIPGKPDQLITARNHKSLSKQIEDLEIKQRALEIELKMAIGDKSLLDFGKDGKVSWVENKNGTRIFKNNIK
jgi:hypothetical protein